QFHDKGAGEVCQGSFLFLWATWMTGLLLNLYSYIVGKSKLL
ncbi:hypothetical protein N499_1281B, partial [Wolbachia pipientis wVitA]